MLHPSHLLAPPAPERLVVHADAELWLAEHPAPPGACVVTSLPDVSELPEFGFEGWRRWFKGRVEQLVAWVPERSAVVFFQSDVRVQGIWLDKAQLVLEGAALARGRLLWHRIVCRQSPGTLSRGRATYAHLLGVQGATGPLHVDRHAWEDVLPDGGPQPWSKAMGVTVCRRVCQYLQQEFAASLIVDPFCGQGTVLAAANELGMAAWGVDIARRRCQKARKLQLVQGTPDWEPSPNPCVPDPSRP